MSAKTIIPGSHVLCLSGEKYSGVLPGVVECLDVRYLSQFGKKTAIELGDTAPVGVERGQDGYSQIICFLSLWSLRKLR